MYNLVDTLVIHGVDQKWFSAFALIEGAEEMVMLWLYNILDGKVQ